MAFTSTADPREFLQILDSTHSFPTLYTASFSLSLSFVVQKLFSQPLDVSQEKLLYLWEGASSVSFYATILDPPL